MSQPPSKPRSNRGRVFAVLALAVLAILIYGPHKEPPAPPKKEAPPDYRATEAYAGAETLRSAMRDPSSFELIEAIYTTDTASICYTYRAKNGFGGMNVERAIIEPKTKTFHLQSMPGFARAFDRLCRNHGGLDETAAVDLFMH